MYGQQGIPGVGPMVNMGVGPQGFPRFNPQQAAGLMQGGGVGGQRGVGGQQMNGQGMGGYQLMQMPGVGVGGQRPGIPGMQPGQQVGPSPTQQQQLLAQQQQRAGQPQSLPGQPNNQQQRGAPGRPGPPPQSAGAVQQPSRNGIQGGVNTGKQQLPPHLLQQPQSSQQGIRYGENVRNRTTGPSSTAQSTSLPDSVVMPLPSEPLTIKALAAAPEEMRKQMIGERLFPLIKMQEPALAGKITGMLLEMDNGELIHLLESHAALNEKISEALQVLQQHPGMEGEGEQEETDK